MNLIDIKLNNGQSGYEVIGEYIKRYWEHNTYTTVIVSIGTSYDGSTYSLMKEVASLMDYDDIEFLNDWWEGEKYIKLFGIKAIDELDISGGIYTEMMVKGFEEGLKKHGYWIKHESAEEYNGYLISNYECSECHCWKREDSKYCPECGLKMDGDVNE